MNLSNKIVTFFRKFKYALNGLFFSIKEEKTLVAYLIIGAIVLIVSGIINNKMTYIDWTIIVIVIFLLIGVELINTAIENVVDMVSFKFNYSARKIKDISAAASLLFSIMAIIVGLLIYIPKFVEIFNGI